MHAHAHPRFVAVDLDGPDRLLRLYRSRGRPGRVGEGRHQTVAQVLGDPASVRCELVLDLTSDRPQQSHQRGVLRLERPRGEVDEIGEDDRELLVTVSATLDLGECLPDLQCAQCQLAGGARTLR